MFLPEFSTGVVLEVRHFEQSPGEALLGLLVSLTLGAGLYIDLKYLLEEFDINDVCFHDLIF